jgi:hypothetical protein
MMTRHISVGLLLLIALLMNPLTLQAAGPQDPLIGKKTINFTLSSTEDRAINYGSEYYDKAFLIVTFFPAAYTPV